MGNPVFAGNFFASRQLRAGWTAGGGIEARLFGNVTGKVEYLHIDLGQGSVPVSSPFNATPINITFRSRISEDLVRLGINYKFDPYALIDNPAARTSAAPARARTRMIARPPVAGALWTWTGLYFGANAGYATASFGADTLMSDATVGTPLLATSSAARLKGGIGGVQSGYNLQIGMWLAGLETDAQFSTQRTYANAICPGAVCNPGLTAMGLDTPVTLALRHSLAWFATARGRLGALLAPDAVAYVTGGLALGGIEHSADNSGFSLDSNGNPQPAPIPFVARTAKLGWAVGGGVEARIAGNVTGKIEYLHMDFGADSAATLNNQNTLPIAVTLHSRLTDNVVRLGINYKLDPNAPAPTTLRSVPDKTATIFKAPVAAVWSWTGYYLGLNAGYSWGRSATEAFFNDATLPGAAFATADGFGIDGKVFGMQTGYNFQSGWWLFGIEADAQLTTQHANPKFVCPGTICNPAGTVVANFDQSQKLEWFSTLRAHFGVAVAPGMMAFLTGGAAVAGLQTSGTLFGYDPTGAPAFNPFSNVAVNAGWTVGGGAEARIAGNWTGKVEYLYIDLGSITISVNNQLNTTATALFNSRLVDHIVRAGLNYKFD
jgi:outer membrane immunogenic protein